jgi:drug/metabolite transporter (DMT)-like permease
MAAVPVRVYLFLAAGLIAASQSGNLIRLGDAHPVAMAAWRLLLASSLLAPLAGPRLGHLRRLSGREIWLLFAAGTSLALHFFTWIAAVQATSVANAAIFFSVNPVLVAAAGYAFFKERPSLRLAAAILLGIAGVVVIGAGDFSLRPEQLAGDGWALLSAALFTAYFLAGKRLRRTLPTDAYVTALYAVAAAVGFAGMAALGLPAVDYSGRTWLCFGLLALVPTMIGHTSLNHALRYLRAGWLSTATLAEPLLAGTVAYFAWGEAIGIEMVAGYALVALSVVLLASDRPAEDEAAGPHEAAARPARRAGSSAPTASDRPSWARPWPAPWPAARSTACSRPSR